MEFEFIPHGVCSQRYIFDIDENTDIIKKCIIQGGCPGNTTGISKLIIGMNVNDVLEDFEGTDCRGKGTSCPDQISKALRKYLESK